MRIRVCGSLIVGLLMCAASAFAQQGTSEIRGRLNDAQGGALPGVSVTVRNQDTGMFRETVSNPDGKATDLAKYFVPASAIAAFIPTEYRF